MNKPPFIALLAAELAARVPALKQDCVTNNAAMIEQLLWEGVAPALRQVALTVRQEDIDVLHNLIMLGRTGPASEAIGVLREKLADTRMAHQGGVKPPWESAELNGQDLEGVKQVG